MLNIHFEINGRKVNSANAGDAIEAAFLSAVENVVRSKLEGIRDPDTGEFPVVAVRGNGIENLTFNVSGSPKLIALVEAALSGQPSKNVLLEQPESRPPHAFLCHSSKDKALARRIANDLHGKGIQTFFDEWEIGPGDSLRQRIDQGLDQCTHFIALLTCASIDAPWVNAEMDAAFVQKLSGRARFIPLRSDLAIDRLPPLLRALHSPALEDYAADIQALISFIHGGTEKPPVGPPPRFIQEHREGRTGLSPAAETIARLMIEESEHGDQFDPQLEGEELRKAIQLGTDDVIDAVDELEGRGLIRTLKALGAAELGFVSIAPSASLFSELDHHFMQWRPAEDALRVAAELVNGAEGQSVQQIAESLGWQPRRMNPALNWLIARDLVQASEACGTHPWTTHWIGKTPKTRRFVRDRS